MPKQRELTDEAIAHILQLRRLERSGTAGRRETVAVREFLERIVGPTLRPADAARLLGVSKSALIKWLDQGEIATVMTPRGRREIPTTELIGLLEDVEHARSEGAQRPLSRVISNRRRRASESVDVDRLLPRRSRTHRTAEVHSLAYHRLVAERLDQGVVDEARRRLANWRRAQRIDPRWADAWEKVLGRPVASVAKTISADTPRARALRQTSPFAGLLTEQERRRLTQAVEARMG